MEQCDSLNQYKLNNHFSFDIQQLFNSRQENNIENHYHFDNQVKDNFLLGRINTEHTNFETLIFYNKIDFISYTCPHYILITIDKLKGSIIDAFYLGGVNIGENDRPNYSLFKIDKEERLTIICKDFYSYDLLDEGGNSNLTSTLVFQIQSNGEILLKQ